jgi:hypothetical protein
VGERESEREKIKIGNSKSDKLTQTDTAQPMKLEWKQSKAASCILRAT